MKPYSALASFYDRLMTDFNYEEMVGFILSEIDVFKKNGLSLCDGTGKISIALSRAGAKMTGSDISLDMLQYAMENAKSEGQNIVYTLLDINEFSPLKTYDFIVCVCDGVNYLSRDNLNSFLKSAYNSIKDGGKFIFDISSSYKLKKIIKNNTFFLDDEDIAYIFSNNFCEKENRVDMSVTLFAKEGKLFRRYIDDSTQFVFEKEEIVTSAIEAGFLVQVLDGTTFTKAKEKSERLLFVLSRSKK